MVQFSELEDILLKIQLRKAAVFFKHTNTVFIFSKKEAKLLMKNFRVLEC